jgi:hypothetical protein
MPRPHQAIADGLVYREITSPVNMDEEHLFTELFSIEVKSLRAGLVMPAGDILKGS